MSRRGLVIVVFVQFAALIAACLLIGDNGWDDGAITLAFARTFARHGVVALTPRSETVEGFSSVSWFLLNALPALARPSFERAILFSQVLSVLSICASTALLGRTCSLLRLDRRWTTLTVITFAAWGCSFYEAGNGMEMGLLAAAFLVLVNELLSPQPRAFWLAAGVFLAVTTRFEAVVYVALLALGVVSVRGRRAFWVIVAACVGTVLLLSSWRLAVFGDVLPNTFWAKRWPPYAAFGVMSRLTAALELPFFFVVPLGALAILRSARLDLGGVARERRRALLILGYPIAGRHPDGWPARKALGLLGPHAVLRVPARARLAGAAVLVVGERHGEQAPGRRRGRIVRVRARPVDDRVSIGNAGRRVTRRQLRGHAAHVCRVRPGLPSFRVRRGAATTNHPHARRRWPRALL